MKRKTNLVEHQIGDKKILAKEQEYIGTKYKSMAWDCYESGCYNLNPNAVDKITKIVLGFIEENRSCLKHKKCIFASGGAYICLPYLTFEAYDRLMSQLLPILTNEDSYCDITKPDAFGEAEE